MCGIVGIFNYKSERPVSAASLEAMVGLIRHRGPDDSGVIVDGPFGAGMTRLAIIDLTDGAQPMRSADGRYSIVFNGEIYNYRELRRRLAGQGYSFLTHSDTEVILALKALGSSTPAEELRGMFAYALFDHVTRSLELCRDRLGKKPLFWAETSDGLIFGSEIKTILASGLTNKEIDLQAISDFLTLSYVPGDQTPFTSISQLAPAHTLHVSDDIEIRRYWQVRTLPEGEKPAKTKRDWLEEATDKLAESVRYRLVSDVPVAVFLSGGIDSALVLSLALRAAHRYPITTYTVGFDSTSYDERSTARWVARHFDVENQSIELRPGDIRDHFEDVVHHSDNLLANPAIYANYLLSALASQDIKVALNGGGGDELFFGYPTYNATRLASVASWLPGQLHSALHASSKLIPVSHKKLSASYRARKFLEGAALSSDNAHYWWRTIITEPEKRSLLRNQEPFRDTYWSYEAAYREYAGDDAFEKYSFADLMVWWRSMGLYQADCMSMANSLELRVPMMDHEFVELVYRIPRRFKFRYSTLKPFLKDLARGILPASLLKMKKSGFHVPLGEWFCGPLHDFVLERLSDTRVAELPFLNPTSIRDILQQHFDRQADNSFKINNLLILVEWYHQFVLSTPATRPLRDSRQPRHQSVSR